MGTKTTLFGASVALCIAIFYQLVLKDLLYLTLGVGRSHQKIEEFPYKCRRIYSPFLESCEDMVLDTEGRRLYATCSSLESRRFWSPGLVQKLFLRCNSFTGILLRSRIGVKSTMSRDEISKIMCQYSTSMSLVLTVFMACTN